MSSRFNTLYLGPADEAVQELENTAARGTTEQHVGELRIALINALNRIADLERRVAQIDEAVTRHMDNAV
jgi:hypothetical protein